MTKQKIFFLLAIILIVLSCLITIPYWTGIEAERRFTHFNESFYPTVNLKTLKTTYQRGWFQSRAETVVEILNFSDASSNPQTLLLIHDIDHGFMPVQSVLIRTSVYSNRPVETVLNKTEDEVNILLEVRTAIQLNGDSLSRLRVPTLMINEQNARLQWEGLEGRVYLKRDLSMLKAEMAMPKIDLETTEGQIIIRDVMLNAELQPNQAVLMASKGSLTLAEVEIKGKQTALVKLQDVTLQGSHDVENDYLSVLLNTGLQQIQVGTEAYGPGYSDFKLHHWHVPTLTRIKNILSEIRDDRLPKQQQTQIAMFQLMPQGLALLKQNPELAITRLQFITNEGELQGTVRIKMEDFDNPVFTLIMNPYILLNGLNVELDMQISQSLYNWTQEHSKETASQNPLGQYLKMLLSQGILIPTVEPPNYYRSQIQLKKGVLDINGQQLPLESLLNHAQ
jgi:uncharacterized protein YdgA (DUF945 family)